MSVLSVLLKDVIVGFVVIEIALGEGGWLPWN